MLDLIVAGLPGGAMYGLAALGIVVVHRATGNVDLSLGGVATAAAYTYHHSSTVWGAPRLVAAALGLLLAAVSGLLSAGAGRVVGGQRPVATAAVSLAWGGVLMSGCLLVFGGATEFVAPLLPDVQVRLGGMVLTGHQVLVLAAAVCGGAVGVWLLRGTAAGLRWRACADNRAGAELVGLPVRRYETASYLAAALLSGVAGILLVPLLYLDATALTLFFLLKPAAAAAAGSLLSMPVALVAATATGVLESLSVRIQQIPGLGESAPFAVAAIALLLSRPVRGRERPEAALAKGPTGLPGSGRVTPGAAAALVALLVVPALTPYQSNIAQLAALTALLAATHVVFTGWGGQLCLAQPAFAGMGGIVAARTATEAGWPFPPAVAAGTVVAAAAAGIVGGMLARRVTELRFALLTLAFGLACSGTLFTWQAFSGDAGDRSLAAPAIGPVELTGNRYTGFLVVVVAVTFLGLRAFARSGLGAALVAGREHDHAAAGLQLPVTRARWAALCLTGAVAGLAGALTAYQLGTVAPEQFHPLTALPILSAAALGGMESLWGGVVGALLVTVAPELLRQADAPDVAALVAPLALLVVVLLRPGGLVALRPRGSMPLPPRRRALVKAVHRRPPPAPDTVGLHVRGLVVRYGSRTAVGGVDIRVRPGEVVALVGANGAGKTTVLDAIAGATPATAGDVLVDGRPHRTRRRRRARAVVRTLQSGGLFERLSVAANLEVPRRWHRVECGDEPVQARALAAVPAGELAGGTARLIEITRAAALRPAVLLLDEPAAGLTAAEAKQMLATVRSMTPSSAILLVEHNPALIRAADHVVLLHEGKVLAHGLPEDVLTDWAPVGAYLGDDRHNGAPAGPSTARTNGRPAASSARAPEDVGTS